MAEIGWRFEVLDASEPQIRALVHEYGFDRAMVTARQFYGRWDDARKALEAERQRLQVSRYGRK